MDARQLFPQPNRSPEGSPANEATSIGERIKTARKNLDLNQADLAKRLNVSQPTVANWESGIHDPRRLVQAKIADALSVPLSWLSQGARSPVESDKHPAAGYLRRILHHVPIISYKNAERIINEKDVDPHEWAEDYIPVTYSGARLFAVFVSDDAVNLAFPPDTLVVIDYTDKNPVEESFCLAIVDGECVLRRWRANPARLEPFSNNPHHETLYIAGNKHIIGSVRVSIRFH